MKNKPLPKGELTREEWKSVKGYEGLYDVSDTGRVRSLNRMVLCGKVMRNLPGKILKLSLSSHGYAFVSLPRGRKNSYVHKMVTLAFFGESTLEVDHINGIRDDNRLENLRYCTRCQNMSNQKRRRGSLSQYKGVSWDDVAKSWRARMKIDHKNVQIGNFKTEKEAAIAYDRFSLERNGEFARLNFPK